MSTAPRILTTLFVRDLPKGCAWRAHSDLIHPAEHSLSWRLRRLLRRAPDYDVVVLNGSSRDDQLAAVLLRRLRPKVPFLITDCQWKVESSWLGRSLTRFGFRLLNGPRSHYSVLSSVDQRNFATTWGVDPARVFVTFWFPAVSDEELLTPVAEQGYVFAGGDSLRDYRTLIDAAGSVPFEVRIATNLPPPVEEADLPPNLTYGPLPQEEYFRAMCDASVNVVALMAGTPRSAGQTTYQVVRALGKLVVVNDATGVREYISDRETGLIVPSGDSAALAETLKWALDPANSEQVREISANGKRDVLERFSKESYTDSLLEIATELVAVAESP
jgi:glycosyltransferase involved in cell wall biosynthesis